MLGKGVVIAFLLVSILVALAMVVGAWQFSASRRARVALTKDADYRRLADMEYRDDEMALFESVLVSDRSLGRFSRAQLKEPIGSSSSGSTSTSTTR